VHINSGIPNKAYYLTAIGVGGFAWEALDGDLEALACAAQ
jgi:Zn-dependent metalloprotease